jgi:hypothetical protein
VRGSLAHDEHGAVGVAYHRVGDAAQKGPPYAAKAPTTHDDQVRAFLLCQDDDLPVGPAPPQVLPRDLGALGLHPLRFGLEQSLGLPFELVLVEPGQGTHLHA